MYECKENSGMLLYHGQSACKTPSAHSLPLLKTLDITNKIPFSFPTFIDAPNLETLTIEHLLPQLLVTNISTVGTTVPTWPQLTTLTLRNVRMDSELVLEFLRASPSLATLAINDCDHVIFLLYALLPFAVDRNRRDGDSVIVPGLKRLHIYDLWGCKEDSGENWGKTLVRVMISRPVLFVECDPGFWRCSPISMEVAQGWAGERLQKL
jgi:hypothetical protein